MEAASKFWFEGLVQILDRVLDPNFGLDPLENFGLELSLKFYMATSNQNFVLQFGFGTSMMWYFGHVEFQKVIEHFGQNVLVLLASH